MLKNLQMELSWLYEKKYGKRNAEGYLWQVEIGRLVW
jgi:hypothetical protein